MIYEDDFRDTFHGENNSNGDALETFETIKRDRLPPNTDVDEFDYQAAYEGVIDTPSE